MLEEFSITGKHPEGRPVPEFRIQFDHEDGKIYFFIGNEDEVGGSQIEVSREDAKEILYEGLKLVNEQISKLAVKKDF